MDYFAVSLPDLLVWEDSLDRRNRIHCRKALQENEGTVPVRERFMTVHPRVAPAALLFFRRAGLPPRRNLREAFLCGLKCVMI